MQGDLGFTYRKRNDCYEIYHRSIKATVLRADKALEFEEELAVLDFEGEQQLMARLTGNYKRGNERQAKNHPRNRGY